MKKSMKIIGAVLGVLLVAALFSGAAAAENTDITKQIVFAVGQDRLPNDMVDYAFIYQEGDEVAISDETKLTYTKYEHPTGYAHMFTGVAATGDTPITITITRGENTVKFTNVFVVAAPTTATTAYSGAPATINGSDYTKLISAYTTFYDDEALTGRPVLTNGEENVIVATATLKDGVESSDFYIYEDEDKKVFKVTVLPPVAVSLIINQEVTQTVTNGATATGGDATIATCIVDNGTAKFKGIALGTTTWIVGEKSFDVTVSATPVTVEDPVFVLGAGIIVGGVVTAEVGSGPINLDDVEVWKLVEGTLIDAYLDKFNKSLKDTVWTAEDGTTVKFLEDPNYLGCYYIDGAAFDGTYCYTAPGTNITFKINVKHLAAPTGYIVMKEDDDYIAVGGLDEARVDKSTFDIKITTGAPALAWVNPAGTLVTTNPEEFGFVEVEDEDGIYDLNNDRKSVNDLGVYTVYAAAKKGMNGYASVAPDVILGNEISFEVYDADESKALKALSDDVLQGNFVSVELSAPYGNYTVSVENGTIPDGQTGVITTDPYTEATIIVGLDGVRIFTIKPDSDENIKVKLYKKDGKTVDKSITIKVVAGKITVDDDVDASTYIGNEVKITGTNELGGKLTVFIKGPNFAFEEVDKDAIVKAPNGKTWEAKIDTGKLDSNGKRPDAGNYTFYFAKLTDKTSPGAIEEAKDLDDKELCESYTTAVVALKQPFIRITEAPAVVVKGDHIIVKGTAEGKPSEVAYYIFGTNFFLSAYESVDDDGVFEIDEKLSKEGKLLGMDMGAGQYFLVIQHPMYDKNFNVAAFGTYITKNTAGPAAWNDTIIIDTNERQSANAAQALCDELDDQKIDDMYVKASFFVAGASSVIGNIPEQIVKGEKLTISGVAVGHKNEAVSVELLSTAFAAVPKETVGSASFISVVTRVGEDGLWTVTIDTSDLNADDYTASVSVGQLDPATQKIKIVEGTVPTPTTEPTTQPTVQPTGAQPTQTPASPGFGILAALAGLGAVAVLLLRRQ